MSKVKQLEKGDKGKVAMDGEYEVWENRGSVFFVKKKDRKCNKKAYTGKINIGGTLYWFGLFENGEFNGKPKYSLSLESPVKK